MRRAAELVVAPALGVTLLTFVVMGDQSEEGGYSESLGLPDGGGVTAAYLAAGIPLVAVALLAARRSGAWLPPAIATALGVVSGASLRVLSAKTVGANIGAGMVVLGWPVMAILLLRAALVALRRGDEG